MVMLSSTVSRAVLRSSRTSIETSPLSETLRRSLISLTSSAMGSKTRLKHGKHGSSAGGQALRLDNAKNILTAHCYHDDEIKYT